MVLYEHSSTQIEESKENFKSTNEFSDEEVKVFSILNKSDLPTHKL